MKRIKLAPSAALECIRATGGEIDAAKGSQSDSHLSSSACTGSTRSPV